WTQRAHTSSSSSAAKVGKSPGYLRILDHIINGLQEPSRFQHLKNLEEATFLSETREAQAVFNLRY
ncbi:uncharacterized protein BDZ83DRAFT_733715, partial [Colletotrichum acutatum]